MAHLGKPLKWLPFILAAAGPQHKCWGELEVEFLTHLGSEWKFAEAELYFDEEFFVTSSCRLHPSLSFQHQLAGPA